MEPADRRWVATRWIRSGQERMSATLGRKCPKGGTDRLIYGLLVDDLLDACELDPGVLVLAQADSPDRLLGFVAVRKPNHLLYVRLRPEHHSKHLERRLVETGAAFLGLRPNTSGLMGLLHAWPDMEISHIPGALDRLLTQTVNRRRQTA